MKKRILASLLALCMFIAVAPISALAADPVTTEEELLAAVENGGEITLGASLIQSIVIPAGKTVILNLNGNTLTNNGSADTITVEQGASLIVTGSGIVKNTADGRGAVFNNGTAELNGGRYERTGEWYVLLNHGSMTIGDGVQVVSESTYSSMIENGYQNYGSGSHRTGYVEGTNSPNPSLTILGGEFSGGLNTVKNDDGGTMAIHGGTFSNTTQAAILNWNVATITDGEFDVTTDYAVVLNGKNDANTSGDEVLNKGDLTIEGGTFRTSGITAIGTMNGTSGNIGSVKISGGEFEVAEGSESIISAYGADAAVTVSGGKFSESVPQEYLAGGMEQDENGEIVKPQGTIQWDPDKTGGTAPVISGNTVVFDGEIGWYDAVRDPEGNVIVEAGNQIGLQINAPEGFDTSGSVVRMGGVEVAWDEIRDGDNFFLLYTLVETTGASFTIEIAWSEDNVQVFTVEIGENATLAAKPAVPVDPEPEAPAEPEGPVNPATGDLPAAVLWTLLALACVGLSGTALVMKKAKAR